MIDRLEEQLIRHEGLRLKPYRCTAGFLTIGVGRNLDANGISEEEARLMLRNDMAAAGGDVQALLGLAEATQLRFSEEVRLAVLINMAFNMGRDRLRSFRRLRQAVLAQDWDLAEAEMLNSRWAEQVGARAVELGKQMRTGEWGE